MSVVPIGEPEPAGGTLLWIGDPTLPEFRPIYQHCQRHAAQIALRSTELEAIGRPAAAVERILVARATRQPWNREAFGLLSKRHGEASWLDLLGPLCEGIRESSISDSPRVAWHRWEQVLPTWMRGCSLEQEKDHAVARSVAIIAANFDIAEAYLDLAGWSGATAIWSPTPNTHSVRNVDAVWWDDSVATAVSPEMWRNRIEGFDAVGGVTRHAWITHAAPLTQRQDALAAGIETVLSKPFRIEALAGMLVAGQVPRLSQRRAA